MIPVEEISSSTPEERCLPLKNHRHIVQSHFIWSIQHKAPRLYPTYILCLICVTSSNVLDCSPRDTYIYQGGPSYDFERHEFPGDNVWGKLGEPRNILLTVLVRSSMQSPVGRTNTALFCMMWMDSKGKLPPPCKKGCSLWPKFLSVLHTAAKLGRSTHNISVVFLWQICGTEKDNSRWNSPCWRVSGIIFVLSS